MGCFNQEEFIQFALDHVLSHGVVEFLEEPTEFSSGRMCHCKVNWREVMNDVALMDNLSDYVIAFSLDAGLHPDCFYGVSGGTSKIGVITQYKWAKWQPDFSIKPYSLPMGRGKPKERGPIEEREFCRKVNANIVGVIVLTDRLELRDDGRSAREAVEDLGVQYFALSNAFQIVVPAYEILNPREEIARKVEDYYDRYGIKPLRLLGDR